MLKLLLLSALLFFSPFNEPVINKEEALKAFTYLNELRTDPKKHLEEFPFLKEMRPIHNLKWNDTLARVAEARAVDLVKRNYFGHTDPDGFGANYHINKAGYHLPAEWLIENSANYFESLSAGSSSGKDAIANLVIDANTPSLGHRNHLLGLTSWDSSLVDIGIGYVTAPGSRYGVYTCVIIAKRDW